MSIFARWAWPGSSGQFEFHMDGKRQTVDARFLLVNFGRNVLAKYIGQIISARCHRRRFRVQDQHAPATIAEVEGEKVPGAEALCGTFHSDEGYEQMNASYDQACSGPAAGQNAVRSLLPHLDRRQHSFARACGRKVFTR